MASESKAELIRKVLEGLAEERFAVFIENGKETVVIPGEDRPFHEKEDEFIDDLILMKTELETVEGTAIDQEEFVRDWGDWETKSLLRRLLRQPITDDVLDQLVADMGLTGLHYEQVIERLYEQLRTGENPVGRELVELRERLSAAGAEERERQIRAALKDSMTDVLAGHYAKRLAGRFPRMVRRAEKLQAVPAEKVVPSEVQSYLTLATRLYVDGHFTACLILCRASIEFALRNCLSGNQTNEYAVQFSAGADGLLEMIGLARQVLPWSLKKTLDAADQVRLEANKALHRAEPAETLCEEMFMLTRGVLRELYSQRDRRLG